MASRLATAASSCWWTLAQVIGLQGSTALVAASGKAVDRSESIYWRLLLNLT